MKPIYITIDSDALTILSNSEEIYFIFSLIDHEMKLCKRKEICRSIIDDCAQMILDMHFERKDTNVWKEMARLIEF